MPSQRGVRSARSAWSAWSAWAVAAASLVAAGLTGLTGCSGTSGGSRGQVDVVASTDVWGSVAAAVGGRWVVVTSVISEPDQDPHSYEGSARVLLDVTKADLVLENGGGYDDFMSRMVASSGTHAPVIDAVTVSRHAAPPGGELNEHVWYDVSAAARVADAIAGRLADLAPRHAADFAANAEVFQAAVHNLVGREQRVRAAVGGQGVGITEPVPLYMLQAMGLRNLTPPEFSRAVEDGSDVAVRVLASTLALYEEHRVVALVYNEQTSGPITEQVKSAAAAAGIPVVPVTETLPEGASYLSWMQHNIDRVAKAVTRP